MRLGLAAFAMQCIVIALSSNVEMIFLSIGFSMLANLVYPSVSSLVSKLVDEEEQGEALGALNGIKAVTEGFGPLVFGTLMSLYETFPMPGAPYLFAAAISIWALLHCYELPPEPGSLTSDGGGLLAFTRDRDADMHGVDLSEYVRSRREPFKMTSATEKLPPERRGLLDHDSDDEETAV